MSEPAATADGLRTDPKTFLVKAVAMIGQLAIPIAIASVSILNEGDLGDLAVYFLPIIVVVLAFNFGAAFRSSY